MMLMILSPSALVYRGVVMSTKEMTYQEIEELNKEFNIVSECVHQVEVYADPRVCETA